MRTEETIHMLSDPSFLDKLYGYAYHRCRTSHEAEDLCSDIVLAVLRGIRKGREVENFYAFVWTVARRVYADYCEKRKQCSDRTVEGAYEDNSRNIMETPIEDFLEREAEREELSRVMEEISFLSKIYRDVMVMYYLDEKKTAQIAAALGISETTVKQRLFYARGTIKKGVQRMKTDTLTLKPVDLQFVGRGDPIGNDPSQKAERLLSRNLVYLCRSEARTAKELSEALGVPMPYIENELAIQCEGKNGSYGLLRDLGNGKYISNILIAKAEEFEEANKIYEQHLDEFCACLEAAVDKSREKILSFPFLSPQTDVAFILWPLISFVNWKLKEQVNEILAERYFADIVLPKREFTSAAVAVHGQEPLQMGFYGCDGVVANDLCGYARVFFDNIYGERMDKHFGCDHNLSIDPEILLTLRAIGGISADSLSEEEKEIAAKAIECGYLRRNGRILEPKILVFREEDMPAFTNLLSDFDEESRRIAEKIAGELAAYMKRHIPKHLLGEYPNYNLLIAGVRILRDTIEECIRRGMLTIPESRIGADGTFMTVKKVG
ncbi:MAG TPA: RNA polymerase sigma factor [Candidatus Limivivens intestinipullorum]|uniref:RNA polymerase sigma factor n=1 Tax=Candidatus Limivivens intestinipullorum TaxID=2840858 RepID=A0A9D1EVP2_9FIRM|nr:RNA polymerase sigma factor [Candidatus Limivivens intestinipullorum]